MTVYKIIPASVVAEQFRIMECQIYMLPPDDADISPYQFREPDQPAITKPGWIKSQVIGMLTDESDVCVSPLCLSHRANLILQESYRCLQGYITNCDIQIKDPTERARFAGGRYMPLPEKRTVEWYARSLAPGLGIEPSELEGMSQRTKASFQVWLQTMQSQPNGVVNNEFIEEEFIGGELSDGEEYEEDEEEEEDYDLSSMSIECDQPPTWDI